MRVFPRSLPPPRQVARPQRRRSLGRLALGRLALGRLALGRLAFGWMVASVLFASWSTVSAQSKPASSLAEQSPNGSSDDEPDTTRLLRVTLQREQARRTLDGHILIEASDGGLLFETRDTGYHLLQPDQIQDRRPLEGKFEVFARADLQRHLLNEFPGFDAYSTANYLIIHNTSRQYAEWCGGLYERLHRAFLNYWKTRGIRLQTPEYPLVAVVFRSRADYEKYALADIGPAAKAILGYYNIQTNRVVMFDLTGVERATSGQRLTTVDQINRILMQPAAERTVATIVHEATHQISYNCRLQTRLAGNPKWLSEGMAIFFETPDLSSRRGWAGIGKVHPLHLTNFKNRGVGQGGVRRIVVDDSVFQRQETAGVAYSQAWALVYFLQKTKSREFAAYVRGLSELPPLAEEQPDQRLARFEEAFGEIDELEQKFLATMSRLR